MTSSAWIARPLSGSRGTPLWCSPHETPPGLQVERQEADQVEVDKEVAEAVFYMARYLEIDKQVDTAREKAFFAQARLQEK